MADLRPALAALLLGCGGTGTGAPGGLDVPLTEEDPAGVRLDLIETVLAEGRAYAAFAHLEGLEASLREIARARWLTAEALRRIGRLDAAGEHYAALLESGWAGLAQRGLGLIAAERGDVAGAVSALTLARDLSPTDGRIRNDLGYALLLAEDFAAARFELTTAIELQERAAVPNLVLLLLVRGEDAQAETRARGRGLIDESISTLRALASQMARTGRASPREAGPAARARSQEEAP